jgi:hypothetical protein
VPDRGDLAVSIFVPENTGPATWHFQGRQTSFISPPGDFTASAVMPVSSTTQTKIRALYDSGDHGHPNDLGYNAMANAIDLKLFRNDQGQH